MPTFKIAIREHQERQDGKFPVSIRLTHNRASLYLPTDIYVTRKQFNPETKELTDKNISRRIDRDILDYEDLLLKGLGTNLKRFSAHEIKDYIEKQTATQGGAGIDFIAFSRGYIERIKKEKAEGYAKGFETLIRALIDFFGREPIYIKEINSKNLNAFADWLQTKREMIRVNQFGKQYKIERAGVSPQTVKDYLGDLRTLFTAAADYYNGEEEETTIISHNPFKRVEIKVNTQPDKRDLPVEDLAKIINCEIPTGIRTRRMELARDIFLLSFYLIGMNTADLFGELAEISEGRITYKRQKTTTRRKDEAIMSVKIEPEAEPLIEKYADPKGKRAFCFYQMYADFKGFNAGVNKGLKQLAETLDIDRGLSTYYARHTWATMASEDCEYNEMDVARALNHVGEDGGDFGKRLKVTRGYIHRRWEKTDKMNRQVLDFVAKNINNKV